MIEESVAYLESDAALRSLQADSYWPKWDSPWWHMLLLHEMGETARIPAAAMRGFVVALGAMRVKIFPIHEGDFPADADPQRDSACHCQLGNAYRVMDAWGIDVDAELPWIKPWFLKYQMADGGLNCDNEAYLVADECPSSMVGTIAVFEAVLMQRRAWNAEEMAFLERGAAFLIKRKLRFGSETQHNAEEREAAKDWGRLIFPRFYFYDVLRGLSALVLWAERTGNVLPVAAVEDVVRALEARCVDGAVVVERDALAGKRTLMQLPSGDWDTARHAATVFPLLEKVSGVGEVSAHLSKQWAETKERLSGVPRRK